ncbi:metallophosphoesterase [Pseudalkalibacillus hwajinpoensis]|uniref:metallophosphoesterase n=1 Tax=Guptibacillus hwajinpoensis TaxID=208199 RepID=UPI00325C24B2
MKKRRWKMLMVGTSLILTFSIVLYTFWDNNRLIIVKENILIENLPDEFEGFTILQVTDLHEKEFGNNNKKLLDAINSVDYNAIVFTGDVLDSLESKNYDYFYTLLDGIKNKENAFFTPGNTDPEIYGLDLKGNLMKNEFVTGMEKRGVKLLESIESINNQEAKLYLADFEMSLMTSDAVRQDYNGKVRPKYAVLPEYSAYESTLVDRISVIDELNDSDVLIALNHYPVIDARVDYIKKQKDYEFRKYDLIIAGHYHGGQIRIPFLGALFVPEPWYNNGGILPPQDRVKGFWEYKGTKQYVSAGLGSSDAISVMNFRLFNTPEINVLSLTGGE